MKERFADLSFKELLIKREELMKKYHTLRVEVITAHVENKVGLRTLRRQIAELNTRIYNHADVSGGASS